MNLDTAIRQPFSNVQLELLKLFASNVPDDDLLEIKAVLTNYFFKKAKDGADKAWDERGLDENTLLNTHRRTPYKKEK